MKHYKIISMLSLLGLANLTSAQVDANWLESPKQIPLLTAVATKALAKPVNHERTPITYNYSLIGTAPLNYNNQGYVAESKQYWLNAKAGQLNSGIKLPITSDLAVIRINPLQQLKSSGGLNQNQVKVTQFDQELAVSSFVSGDQLKATGMSVTDQTVAFKVNTVPGELTLMLSGAVKSTGDYVIHVFEPNSDYSLQLQTKQTQFNSEEAFKVQAQMQSSTGPSDMNIQAYISQPNGEKFSDLKFKKSTNGDYEAQLSALPGRSLAHGLWEIHSIASSEINGLKVMRDVSSAFAVEMPTARFNRQLVVEAKTMNIGLDVAIEGRYEVSGVLSGFTKDGIKQPIAMLMTAKWLTTGSHQLGLDLPMKLIKESGLQDPFLVEQVSLKNQTLMVPVQQVNAGIQVRLPTRELTDLR